MKFSVLALDYDGTIAHEGILHPDVRASIEEARLRSIAVVLVTSRILSDFQKIQLDLDLFDAVVAENGRGIGFSAGSDASTWAPTSHNAFGRTAPQQHRFHTRRLRPPGRRILGSTHSRSAAKAAGAVGVGVLNRSRVMLLPQGISKAMGLREALNTLRLSLHNCRDQQSE